jgi:hypothetical protein
MKKIFMALVIFLYLGLSTSLSQEIFSAQKHMPAEDSIALIHLPKLILPELYKGSKAPLLPAFLDNSELPYLRPVFTQDGWSCGQAASIGYNFTYEINRLRDLPADTSIHQYPTHFAYNFFDRGIYETGVCYLYTFEMLKNCGTPNAEEYGGMSHGHLYWMSGYPDYYSGMKNRIQGIYSIYTGDEEGISTVKNWLHDHLNGSQYGGLANFYTDLYGVTNLPQGTPEAGKSVITAFGPYNGHAMTLIGWNDSIRWDYNSDGQYTNDLDINGDGDINVKDWEIGGFKLINSHGVNFADSGFCYVMYKVIAEEKANGGIWNKTVHVIDVKDNYAPSVAFKIKLKHSNRSMLKVTAGISTDTAFLIPEFTMDFPIFTYQGGDHYLTGTDSLESNKILEFGLDVTPLLTHISSGQDARYFIQVHEYDPYNQGNGRLESFSLIDYQGGGLEIPGNPTDIPLNENGITTSSVVHAVNFNKPVIQTDEIPPYVPGQPYSAQLTATGGTEPYTWNLVSSYSIYQSAEDYPDIQGIKLSVNGGLENGFASLPLDFPFPFYGNDQDTLTLFVDGFVLFEGIQYPFPYQIYDLPLFRFQTMMAPFFNQHLVVTNSDEGIWYEGNESYAAFRWKVTLDGEEADLPLDFTMMIYPDGKIEYYYQEFENPELINKIVGVSGGNGSLYQLADFSNTLPLKNGQIITFQPPNIPSGISISNSGLIAVTPEDGNTIYNLPVMVTDNNNLSAVKSLMLSERIIYDYSVNSGEDNRIEYGESPVLSFNLKNISSEQISNLTLTVESDDPYISIQDGTENIGNIAPGQWVEINDAITISIDNSVPDNHLCTLHLTFNSGSDSWQSKIFLPAYAPILFFGKPVVLDNENNRLDPGETAGLVISVQNLGHSTANGVTGLIHTEDPFITINGTNNLTFGNISCGSIHCDTLTVTTDTSTPNGHVAEFGYTISSPPSFSIEGSFDLLVGRYPVLLADLDPEQMSLPLFSTLLDELSVNYEAGYFLPEDLSLYQNIFVFLGKKFTNHLVAEAEGQWLADFLNAGGNIYMEGGVTWNPDPQTAVHPMFNIQTQNVGWNYYNPVIGVPFTFTENMEFEYNSGLAYYNYFLIPTQPAYSILHGSAVNHSFAVAYNQGNYRTIGATTNFFGLIDGTLPSTKKELLKGMLDFFGVNYSLTPYDDIPSPGENPISCQPNPFSEQVTIRFHLNEDEWVSVSLINIYSTTLTEILSDANLIAGDHQIIIDTNDLAPGIYLCQLKSNNKIFCTKVVKVN